MHLILLSLTVALEDDLSLNFKIEVFSLGMHIATVRRAETPRDDRV